MTYFSILLVVILSMAGCKKPEPARLMIHVEGELFSNALLFVDGNQVGKLTQTLIKPGGELFIDDVHTATLPADHKNIPDEDQYTGALDSLEIKSGTHTLLLQTDDGRSLEIKTALPPGMTIITYYADKHLLKCNQSSVEAGPGSVVTLDARKP